MLPSKKVGDKSFYKFITQCICRDWTVLLPIGDCDRFDCVIERGNGFEKVQVKTGNYRNGTVKFPTSSSYYHTKKGDSKDYRKSYVGQIDLFGVYCPYLDKCYIIGIGQVGNAECSLRVEKPKINAHNQYGIKWAKDFEF